MPCFKLVLCRTLFAHMVDTLQPDDFLMQSDAKGSQRTLDLTSSLEVGSGTSNTAGDASSSQSARSVLTIAFQFPFESSMQDNVANMAHQYVRSVISSVQRVAMAISPSGGSPALGPKLSPGSPEALTLAHWICKSYRYLRSQIFFQTVHVGR